MPYLIHILIMCSIYGITSLGLNLIVGYTGLLSAAQAAFYGIGAYVTAILLTTLGLNFFIALILSMLITMSIGFFIGIVLSRFKDDYYALGSLGFGVIVFNIFFNLQTLTRGPLGIPGIARPSFFATQFSDNVLFLILALIILALVYLCSRFIVQSSFGRVLKAIREDEGATQIFGYRTTSYKLIIFMIGAGMASIAGSLFATYITFIDPSSFALNESIFLLAIIILGGLASLRGSLFGAVILVILPELLRFVGMPDMIAAQMRQVIYGVILVLVMLYRPQGLFGEYRL